MNSELMRILFPDKPVRRLDQYDLPVNIPPKATLNFMEVTHANGVVELVEVLYVMVDGNGNIVEPTPYTSEV